MLTIVRPVNSAAVVVVDAAAAAVVVAAAEVAVAAALLAAVVRVVAMAAVVVVVARRRVRRRHRRGRFGRRADPSVPNEDSPRRSGAFRCRQGEADARTQRCRRCSSARYWL